MKEENNIYFKRALFDFAYDAACGAQIRHLTDLGYTVDQIMKELDVTVSYQKVQETVTQHLHDTEVLMIGKPDSSKQGKPEFVREYDRYGRASFRRVMPQGGQNTEIRWQECVYSFNSEKEIMQFLNRKTEENGENASYISCDFGLDKQNLERILGALELRQQEYVKGILWKKTRMYHRLTPMLRRIAARLYDKALYDGECYFKNTGEHIILSHS